MAYEKIEIGPVPSDEPCEQVGPQYDPIRARRECELFVDAIRLTCGREPDGAKLVVTVNAHDFGEYREVAVKFDPTNEAAIEYAFMVESKAPERWPAELRPSVDAMYRAYGPEEGL